MNAVLRLGRFPFLACVLAAMFAFATNGLAAAKQRALTGLVVQADRAHSAVLVSCDSIPGYMDAMVMSFSVRDAHALDHISPGQKIRFAMVEEAGALYAENIQVLPFESLEQDPVQARRLKMLENLLTPPIQATRPLAIGEAVPDFHLIDQGKRPVSLSEFAGKVVAITFVYTRCPFPNYCFRLSNNFGQLQRRFQARMGRDLVLLTVVIDPVHDQPEALAKYAQTWKADPRAWLFLTGPSAEIKRVCDKFDMSFYPDEAIYIHSFHTVVVDRRGRMAANLEGNDFTPEQLGDLVEVQLRADPAAGSIR